MNCVGNDIAGLLTKLKKLLTKKIINYSWIIRLKINYWLCLRCVCSSHELCKCTITTVMQQLVENSLKLIDKFQCNCLV